MFIRHKKHDTDLSDNILISDIHRRRIISFTYSMIAILAFILLYNKSTFTPPLNKNASDIAQIARNIAEGKGYTTRFVRPLNTQFISPEDVRCPELNHPPLYPYTMALMFKLRGITDQCAAYTSMIFLILLILATYLLGKILFNHETGILASVIMGTSVATLGSGNSGEEWTSAALWFTAILISIAMYHRSVNSDTTRLAYVWCIAASISTALLYLTNQVMVFALVPLIIYFAVTGKKRIPGIILFIIIFIVLALPWAYWNYTRTGSPVLGINTWSIMANTTALPGDALYRTTDADLHSVSKALLFPVAQFGVFISKLFQGSVSLGTSLLGILGIATIPLVIVSVLYRFKSPAANAVRGLMYLMLPMLITCFAAYSIDQAALIIFAPVMAAFGSAYFLLLLQSKPLHPIYRKALTGGFIIITALPAVVFMLWKPQNITASNQNIADGLFATAGINGAKGTIYTDVPWMAAWRTNCTSVWVPRSDSDVDALEQKGFSLQAVILTPESDNLPTNEVWYALYKVRLWREYLTAPKKEFKRYMLAEGFSENKLAIIEKDLKRIKSNFALSDSLEGLTVQKKDPLAPDYVQIFIKSNK